MGVLNEKRCNIPVSPAGGAGSFAKFSVGTDGAYFRSG